MVLLLKSVDKADCVEAAFAIIVNSPSDVQSEMFEMHWTLMRDSRRHAHAFFRIVQVRRVLS